MGEHHSQKYYIHDTTLFCIVTRKLTRCIPRLQAPMALPFFCVVISSGESLEIFKIPYFRQWPKRGDRITDGLENNYIVVADITSVVYISCRGFCFNFFLSVEMGAYSVSASNNDVGNLDPPLGDLY